MKAARHCFRLLQQGRELLETGELHVRVNNPQELFAIGELPDDELSERFEAEFARLDAVDSVLPDAPNEAEVGDFLHRARLGFL